MKRRRHVDVKPAGRVDRLREAVASWRLVLRGFRPPAARGPNRVAVMLFGHSHLVCLEKAWTRGLFRPADSALDFKFVVSDPKAFPNDAIVVRSDDGMDTIHPALAQALRASDAFSGNVETWLVSIVRGNSHNVLGLLEPDPPFDFVHPALPTLPIRQGWRLLPYDAVKRLTRRNADLTHRFYACLERRNVAGVLHVEAPPPIPSQKQCDRAIDRKWLARAVGRSEDVRVSPREFRMKLWKCQSDVHRAICAEHHVVYVTPPEDALDDDGYLKPAAWHGATHASPWYGALALRKVEGIITELRRTQ